MSYGERNRQSVPRSGLGVVAAIGVALASHGAQAAVQLCPGPSVSGASGTIFMNGSSCGILSTSTTVEALFVGFSAADHDALTLPGSSPPGVIFDNRTSTRGATDTLTVASAGTLLDFTLNNLTTGKSYIAATGYTNTDAGAFVPVYHFAFESVASAADYATLHSGVALLPSINTFILANGGYSAWTFAFAEDLPLAADDDWNDIVYAFKDVTTVHKVPEPATLALVGAGLMGLGVVRRGRKDG